MRNALAACHARWKQTNQNDGGVNRANRKVLLEKPTFKNNSAASGNGAVADAFVYDDPHQVFEIQGDGASAQTDVMQTADVVVGSGSTVTGVSAMELDSTDIGTGANLVIIGFSGKIGRSEVGSANAVYKVLINEHFYA